MHDNQFKIMNAMRIHKNLTRKELGDITHLSADSLKTHVKPLVARNWIFANGHGEYRVTSSGLIGFRVYINELVDILIESETPEGTTYNDKQPVYTTLFSARQKDR